ncbi:hypothetical protein XENOCAPTIV_025262, partial [Xenoophorus captivus]
DFVCKHVLFCAVLRFCVFSVLKVCHRETPVLITETSSQPHGNIFHPSALGTAPHAHSAPVYPSCGGWDLGAFLRVGLAQTFEKMPFNEKQTSSWFTG